MTATIDPTSAATTDIDRYLAAVEVHLADLEPEELQELLDDLRVHLQEVRAETDERFEKSLGKPAEFAAELRRSAGLEGGPTPGTHQRFGAMLRDRTATLRDHPWTGAAVDFWPELRPGWWVLRGYLLVVLIGGGRLIPSLFGSSLLGIAAAIGAAVFSVRVGRSRPAGRAQLPVFAAGVLAAVGALVLFGNADASSADTVYYGDDHYSLGYQDGQRDPQILPANIFAFTVDGQPLDGVLLFNETGDPIDLPLRGFSERFGAEFVTTYPIDLNGRPVNNLYPRDLDIVGFGYDDNESMIEPARPIEGPPAVNIPPLVPATAAPTTVTPTTIGPDPVAPTTAAPATAAPTTIAPTTTPTTTDSPEPRRGLDGSIIPETTAAN